MTGRPKHFTPEFKEQAVKMVARWWAHRDLPDNALAESWNGTLKVELVHRTVYATREKARKDIARWIELRYNQARLHSVLGYRTLQEVMDEYMTGQEAA